MLKERNAVFKKKCCAHNEMASITLKLFLSIWNSFHGERTNSNCPGIASIAIGEVDIKCPQCNSQTLPTGQLGTWAQAKQQRGGQYFLCITKNVQNSQFQPVTH